VVGRRRSVVGTLLIWYEVCVCERERGECHVYINNHIMQ